MRICSKCSKALIGEGFVIDGGAMHYCSEECLYQDISPLEWEELYNSGDDNYWTSWDTIEFSDDFIVKIDIIRNALSWLVWGSLEDYIPHFSIEDVPYLRQACFALQ